MKRAVRNFRAGSGMLLSAFALVCMLAIAPQTYAAPLGQAGTGTITGQVLSLDDVPLADVRLAAFNQPPGTPDRTPLAEFQSGGDGRFSVDVPAGQVWLEFLTQDIRGESYWGYSNLPVDVVAGQTITGQDFRVAIRIVSEVPAGAPPIQDPNSGLPIPAGMPSTGAGTDMLLPVAAGLGLLLLLCGLVLVQRARATR